MSFHIGQEVECIDAAPRLRREHTGLVRGAIYRVREIADLLIFPVVWVEGVSSPNCESDAVRMFPEWRNDFPFDAARFRAVQRVSVAALLTQSAPKDSRQWDNRHKRKVRA